MRSGREKAMAAERAAWARLVIATETLFLRAICESVRMATEPESNGRDLAPERDARQSAKQALRDLGVDVDELLAAQEGG